MGKMRYNRSRLVLMGESVFVRVQNASPEWQILVIGFVPLTTVPGHDNEIHR